MNNNQHGLTWHMAWRITVAIAAASLIALSVDSLVQAFFFLGHVPVIGVQVFITWGVPIIVVGATPIIWMMWRLGPTDLIPWSLTCTAVGMFFTFVTVSGRILFDTGYAEMVVNEVGTGTASLLLNSAVILLFALPDCFCFGLVSWLVLNRLAPKN